MKHRGMSENEEPDDGRRKHTDSEFIEAIEDGAESTKEIADAVEISRQGALKRLKYLRDDDVVESRKLGNMLLWRLSE